jgi:hypothetical protein
MNQRIRELIKQATNPDYDSDDGPMNEVNVEKFADLLLEEVMQTLFITGHESAFDELNKHFGVEE